MAISQRLRFEILRRDGFRCRYCGTTADQGELHVDHVVPQSLDGDSSPGNLATSCQSCNSGKSSTLIDGPTVSDVTAASLAWAEAIEDARRQAAREDEERSRDAIGFLVHITMEWDEQIYSYEDLPGDADESLLLFRRRGLDVEELTKAIHVTAKRDDIPRSAKWSYFCGVCWNMIRDLERRAEAILKERGY